MSLPPEMACSTNISLQTLSDWRDRALNSTDEQRLQEHIATCAVCQSRLAGFDRVASALRYQHDLDPRQRIWNNLQPHITLRRSPPMKPFYRTVIGTFPIVLSIALIVGLFALILHNRNETGLGSTSTATPIVTPTLTSTITQQHIFTLQDSGKTITYYLTDSSFTIELESSRYPKNEIQLTCTPTDMLETKTKSPPVNDPSLYAVTYNGTRPGTCSIKNGTFLLTINILPNPTVVPVPTGMGNNPCEYPLQSVYGDIPLPPQTHVGHTVGISGGVEETPLCTNSETIETINQFMSTVPSQYGWHRFDPAKDHGECSVAYWVKDHVAFNWGFWGYDNTQQPIFGKEVSNASASNWAIESCVIMNF
jgi:hypothetical protein